MVEIGKCWFESSQICPNHLTGIGVGNNIEMFLTHNPNHAMPSVDGRLGTHVALGLGLELLCRAAPHELPCAGHAVAPRVGPDGKGACRL